MTVELQVRRPGLFCTVQDLGRPGLGSLAVSRSGAADRGSLRLANSLVGNDETAAALETTFGGLTLLARGEVTLAVTGPEVELTIRGRPSGSRSAPFNAAFALAEGEELVLGRPAIGLRNYVAVAGGVDVPRVLGSRSTDVLSGIGPPVVRAGDVLRIGALGGPRSGGLGAGGREPGGPGFPRTQSVVAHPIGCATKDPVRGNGVLELALILGPRHQLFDADTIDLLFEQEWTVTPQSNRIGLRLSGAEPLQRREASELPSEPMTPGALQVPPSGQPVLFLPDHPATGGYPVIGVLTISAQDSAGQARPGSVIRFRRSPAQF